MRIFYWPLICLLSLCILQLPAQTLIPELGEVFTQSVVPRIDILIAESDLESLFAEGNEWSNYEYEATFIFDNGNILDTLESVGFRLRGNTSREAAKKSFKISFNTYVPGRRFYGLKKLNINGEHNDPTTARARVGWDYLRQIDLAGSRANHVELYINLSLIHI